MSERNKIIALIAGVLCSALTVGLQIYVAYARYSEWVQPGFSETGFVILFFAGLVALFGLLIFLAALIGMLIPRLRRAAMPWLCCGLAIIICFFAASVPVVSVRNESWSKSMNTARTIIAAIEQYSKDKGRPPESLDVLPPRYIASIPKTGMGAYPAYFYRLNAQIAESKSPWVLGIDLSNSIAKANLFYWPTKAYPKLDPESTLGNYRVRECNTLGDWCYVEWAQAANSK